MLADRAVTPVLVTNGGDWLRGGIVAGKCRRRIGWHDPNQQKGDNQQPKQRGDGGQRPTQNKAQHGGRSSLVRRRGASTASRPRSRRGSPGILEPDLIRHILRPFGESRYRASPPQQAAPPAHRGGRDSPGRS